MIKNILGKLYQKTPEQKARKQLFSIKLRKTDIAIDAVPM
jgi:hypothetical protein